MPIIPKIALSVVLLSLLLVWPGANRCWARTNNHPPHGRVNRHPARIRLCRSRKGHPAHRPLAPSPKAAIPPDEAEDEDTGNPARETRQFAHDGPETALSLAHPNRQSIRSALGRRRASDEPLHQTLCILLI